MPRETLDQWLAWQKQLHPRVIELGLERVQRVIRCMQLQPPPFVVISVGGTNGKGSCVAFLEAVLRAGGYRVGAYTSPHLMRYNERIRIDGSDQGDDVLCRAFEAVDRARGDVSLTYFEFGTLAALEIFRQAEVQVAVLEVGLGGRLDAVNAVDADAAAVTSIGIDHVAWLGPDRDSIGYEKAGIFRPGRPAICAEPDPPGRLLEHARGIDANLYLIDRDFGFRSGANAWQWWASGRRLHGLPMPELVGEHQLRNAAAALMTLTALANRLSLSPEAIARGLAVARVPGRIQIVPGPVEWILDVAHNVQGAMALARYLESRPCAGRTRGILGVLGDKDARGLARVMGPVVEHWYAAGLGGSRGRTGEALAAELGKAGIRTVRTCVDVVAAVECVRQEAAPGDRCIVFGSFHTVVDALKFGLRGSWES